MPPESLTPTGAEVQPTGGPTPPAADLMAQIEQEMTRIANESQKLKDQAAQKDRQLADMRVRLATLAGTKTQTLQTPQIGQTIPGKGIFAGVWTPKDRDGKSLGNAFNVYAAPEDLTDRSGRKALLTFNDAAKRITALRTWHGHDGGDFANDAAIIQGLADGSAIGKWFIPTRELLTDNLYANQGKGDLKGTFVTNGQGGNRGEYPVWYWSCTEHRANKSSVWHTRFSDGDVVWSNRDINRLSCRPCRVETLVI
jgi:hypothetical protein